ncbi:MAG TPA: nucleotidyltransferase family protein [Gemmatimonadaceae bacterium]
MSSTDKAVILARGLGTRMQRADAQAALSEEQARAADAGHKAMMPIGRPFLDYLLSALADAGITQVCLVVPPDHEAIRNYYTVEAPPTRFTLSYAVQAEPRGTADAVLATRDFVGTDAFLVLNGDNYYPADVLGALARAQAPACVGFDREALVRLGNIDQERIRRYALLRVDESGFLADIVEKPDPGDEATFGLAAPVSMNVWLFGPEMLEVCAGVQPSARGELELPHAVRDAIHRWGMRFRVIPARAGVLDLASRRDVAAVAAALKGVTVRL